MVRLKPDTTNTVRLKPDYEYGPAEAGRYEYGPAEAGRYEYGPADAGYHVRARGMGNVVVVSGFSRTQQLGAHSCL